MQEQVPQDVHIAKKIRQQLIPMIVQWEITQRCNWNCRFCYQDEHITEVLSTEEIQRVIDDFSELGTLKLILTGGEPLVRKDLFQIAEYAKKKGIVLCLYSNGEKLADPEIAEKVSRMFAEVEISILAGDSEIHDELSRKKGSFYKTLQGIKNIHANGTKVLVKTPVTRKALPSLKKLESLLQELSLEWNVDVDITPTYEGSFVPTDDFSLTYEDMKQFWVDFPQYSSLLMFPPDYANLDPNPDSDGLCRAGRNFCFIDAKGNVYPCLQFKIGMGEESSSSTSWAGNGPSANCGNIKEKSFKEIWNQSPMFQKIRSITARDLTICTTCDAFKDCPKCMANNYRAWGVIDIAGPSTCNKTATSMKLRNENFEPAGIRRTRNLGLKPRM
ncbi:MULTISPECIES: radical SAM protein [Laceyella]|uniref:Radical SAM protein n=2 Tax=Laceyella TaxID=292635 RepID=A0ABY5U173_LACSH|nr:MULTISPECIES: radical SAM protein [Laceyella]PRZ16325.1 radical SAM protein with 4Fe4S-binding SPASM domain [Laceyella sediminis]UWE03411.1 radical SAM protein [Laceyella sacchari]